MVAVEWWQWAWSRRRTLIAGLMALLVAGLIAVFPGVPDPPHPVTHCRTGNVLKGVYFPWRLRVYQECVTITGTVTAVQKTQDLDFHIDMRPDPPYQDMINQVNAAEKGGDLVLEVIPGDQKRVPIPKVGDRVEVSGAYVYDRIHGWNEVHPVWRLVFLPK